MWKRFSFRFSAFSLVLFLGLTGGEIVPVLAQSRPLSILARSSVNFQPRQDIGAPNRRGRLGTRGLCPQDVTSGKPKKPLTSLLPVKSAQANLGLTVAAYPTFFYYLPETSTRQVEFLLVDEEERELYSTTLAVSGEPGVIGLSLPSDEGIPPLEVGRSYHWYFSIVCNPGEFDKSRDPIVEGWIRRVELSSTLLAEKLEGATLRDRAALYAADGIWYETISTLAELRQTNPGDRALASTWSNLLHSVGLGHIAQESLVPCCTPERQQSQAMQTGELEKQEEQG